MAVDVDYDFTERAAIMEFCGGLSRAEAERLARKIIEGRGQQSEQIELGLEQQGFRERMRRIWTDY